MILPLKNKVRARSAHTTFEAVAREWHANQKPTWTEGYAEDVMERIGKNIFPFLGNRPVGEITPPELLAVLRKIEGRGSIDQAHRVRSICSLVFRYAIATGRAERDTAADLRGALKTRSHTPRAAITEPKAIGGLLRAIDDFTGTFAVKCALQLLALTFCRPSEVRQGEWAEMDFAEKLWRIPAKRMKMCLDHMVPLSTQALEILQLLTNLGYAPGPVDSQYGRRTADAVKAFQRNMGIPQDGQIDQNLLSLLRSTANQRVANMSMPTRVCKVDLQSKKKTLTTRLNFIWYLFLLHTYANL